MEKAAEVETIEAAGHARPGSVAFADFFAEAYPRLVRSLLPSTGNLAAAEEAAQEAMTRVFSRWGRVGRLESPIGYAYVVAINLIRRRSRRRWKRLGREFQDPRPDPAGAVADRDQIVRALDALPDGERDAVLLVSYLGLSSEEAAGVLGIKPASVRSRVHRARTALLDLKEEKDG